MQRLLLLRWHRDDLATPAKSASAAFTGIAATSATTSASTQAYADVSAASRKQPAASAAWLSDRLRGSTSKLQFRDIGLALSDCRVGR